jgi:hypothetical protein
LILHNPENSSKLQKRCGKKSNFPNHHQAITHGQQHLAVALLFLFGFWLFEKTSVLKILVEVYTEFQRFSNLIKSVKILFLKKSEKQKTY